MITLTSKYAHPHLSTNGILIDQMKAEQIITSGLGTMIISIDGMSQEIYEKYIQLSLEDATSCFGDEVRHDISCVACGSDSKKEAFKKLGFSQQLPNTDGFFKKLLMLPMNLTLEDSDIDYICSQVFEFYH